MNLKISKFKKNLDCVCVGLEQENRGVDFLRRALCLHLVSCCFNHLETSLVIPKKIHYRENSIMIIKVRLNTYETNIIIF